MKKSELQKLLAMITTPDTDPDTFNFVLNRIYAVFLGRESSSERRAVNDHT